MIKIQIVLITVLLVSSSLQAQQDPLYSQYLNNPFILNPAYAGHTDNLNVSLSYRNQWTGLEGSPKTINFNSHISLNQNNMGAGLMVVSDKVGNSTINEVMASYSYRVRLTDSKILSFGLQGGFANYQIDNTKVNPFDPGDAQFMGTSSESKPNVGFGVILKSDRYIVSLSVPRMLKSTIELQGKQTLLYTQHFYAMGGYLFFLSEKVRFKPSTLLRYANGLPLSVDVNTSLILHDSYQVGLLTRNLTTYGLFLQALLKDSFRLGYTFEVPTGSSVGTNFTSHEITIGLRFNALSFHQNYSLIW
jgi:type IX secretion system PorP/SprF family membrane protein